MLRTIRDWLERIANDGAQRADDAAIASVLVGALGEHGDGSDFAIILELAFVRSLVSAQTGLEALRSLKRRGLSLAYEDALSLLESVLEGPALAPADVAEVLSSRADGARLAEIVERSDERAGWAYALPVLGRLALPRAARLALARVADEPDAALSALSQLGGECLLHEPLRDLGDAPDAFRGRARALQLRLAPSRRSVCALSFEGTLTDEMLDTLPSYDQARDFGSLGLLARDPTQPVRRAAARALGRLGGPRDVTWLRELLDEPDEGVRAEAAAALRTLGTRLHALGILGTSSLVDARHDPGEALLAESLLHLLRERRRSIVQKTWLLDGPARFGAAVAHQLDAELARRSLPLPALTDLSVATSARVDAKRAGVALRRTLRQIVGGQPLRSSRADLEDTMVRLQTAPDSCLPVLSAREVDVLLDAADELSARSHAGLSRVFARTQLEPVSALRLRRLLARERAVSQESEVALVAARPDTAAVVRASFESEEMGAALARLTSWVTADPSVLTSALPVLEAAGRAAEATIARFVRMHDAPAPVRSRLIRHLQARTGEGWCRALLRGLLHDREPSVREAAARALLYAGDPDDRRTVLRAALAGKLGDLRIPLRALDVPLLDTPPLIRRASTTSC